MLPVAAGIVRAIVFGIAAVVLAGVLIYITETSTDNAIIGAVMDVARWFADPFRFIADLQDNKAQVVINWGIAAFAYVAAGLLIAMGLDAAASRIAQREDADTRKMDSAKTA